MSKRKKIPVPPLQYSASRALSEAAARRHIRRYLTRGGAAGRARALRDRDGLHPDDAADLAGRQMGKGHAAELSQATSYTAKNGLGRRRERARPNEKANDAVIDVEVLRGSQVVDGAQVKVGSTRYVKAAIESGKYPVPLVANKEARDELAADGSIEAASVVDRLSSWGGEAEVLTESAAIELSSTSLRRVLHNKKTLQHIDKLVIAARAGKDAALLNFCAAFGEGLTAARTAEDVERAATEALSVAARAYARDTLQSAFLIWRFDHKARSRYSAGLLHKTAGMSLVAGEAAEVVVESVVDLALLARGDIEEKTFWNRVASTALRGGGGALGSHLGATITRDAPAWMQALAIIGGGFAGRHLGGQLAQRLFGGHDA